MSGAFDDVVIEWAGTSYTIPASRVMMAIARIEDILTLAELGEMLNRPKTVKLARVASAYAAVLRFAGAAVKDEEVYVGMFAAGKSKTLAVNALMGLLGMMVPTSAIKDAAEVSPPGKEEPAASPSSRKRSRSHAPRSAPAAGA